jgi:hypothetical protein
VCLIVVKPKGKPMPPMDDFDRWFTSHPDGFGLAYNQSGHVVINKGQLSVKAMRKSLKHIMSEIDTEKTDMMFHFRQATDGSVKSHNCHPFPISPTGGHKLKNVCDMAVAHNGIIFDCKPTKNEDKTDSQIFIERYLVPMEGAFLNKGVASLITAYTTSKFCILNGITYILIGKFIEDNGYFYSNLGYLNYTEYYGIPDYHYPYYPQQAKYNSKYRYEFPELGDLIRCDTCDMSEKEIKLYCTLDGQIICQDCVDYFEIDKTELVDLYDVYPRLLK